MSVEDKAIKIIQLITEGRKHYGNLLVFTKIEEIAQSIVLARLRKAKP